MAEISKVVRVGDTLTNVLDKVSGKLVTLNKVTEWFDNTPMDDSKVDGYIYRKKDREYFIKNLGDYGQILQKDTVSELRLMSEREILLLKIGYYKCVRLNGYYSKGDTHLPLDYFISDTTWGDDGGSVFTVRGVKLQHIFNDIVDPRYFGANPGLTDSMPFILKASALGLGLHIINGDYKVTLTANNAIKPSSNTNVLGSNAKLIINPNALTNYSVITFDNVKNCEVLGLEIVGDKYTHTGVAGEWGMGITVTKGSENIKIYNTKISKCWGDGIYIGGAVGTALNKNISIFNVLSDDNRRQGMSVTHVNGLYVNESFFINTSGISPEDGIDLEPNGQQEVRNVYLTNVTCNGNANCGLSVYNEQRENALLEDVHLIGCNFENNVRSGARFMYMKYSTINKCYFKNNGSYGLEIPRDVKSLYFTESEFLNNGSHGVALITSGQTLGVENLVFDKCKFNNNGVTSIGDGFRIDKLDTSSFIKDIKFYNCDFSDNKETATQRYGISTKITADATISSVTLYDVTYTGNISGNRSGAFPLVFVDANRAQLLSGTTVNRPTTNVRIGQTYFDTQLNKVLVWNGTAWLDAIPNATIAYYGTVRQSGGVANSTEILPAVDVPSTAADIPALLVDLNDVIAKYNRLLTVVTDLQLKLNSKLNADRTSGQQLT